MFARENFTRLWFLTRTYFKSRMIEGSLMANVMEWISCSYSSMTSTFPAKKRVKAFFHEIIVSGSNDAFSNRVACILWVVPSIPVVKLILRISHDFVKGFPPLKPLCLLGFPYLLQLPDGRRKRTAPA